MDRFVFWGLFLMFGLIVLGYGVWMVGAERAEAERAEDRAGVDPEAPGP